MQIHLITILFTAFLIYILPPGGFSAWSFEAGVRWFYLFFISFLIFNITYPFIYKLAWKIKAIDIPDERKIHLKPTPRIGGAGIYLAFILTVIRNFQFSKEIVSILMASTIIFITGLIDDVKGLSAKKRLVFQLIAAIIVVGGGLKITYTLSFGNIGEITAWIISILWIVGITNSFNFMDGIDGLAGIMGFIISLIFLMVCINTNQYKVMFVTASLCGAIAGFLIYNINPAKIFLGDSGSTLIGFILACLGIYVSWADNRPLVSMIVPVIILSIPIFDLIYTTVSRIKRNQIRNITEWLEYAAKDHFHHRLIKIGFTVNQSVFFIGLLNLLLGLISIIIIIKDETIETFFSFFLVILIYVIIVMLMIISKKEVKI